MDDLRAAILARRCGMRIPLTFDLADCEVIAQIIADAAAHLLPSEQGGPD